jgi:putative membrane protein
MHRHYLGLFAAMLSVSACADSPMGSLNPMTWWGGEAASGAARPADAFARGQTTGEMMAQTTPMPGSGQATPMPGAMMGQAGQVTAGERAFVVAAAQGNVAEIRAGELARQRTTSQPVRQFAQRMINDHTRANQELMQIASRHGITPPSTPDPADQAAYQTLQQLSGTAFDRQYLEQQYGGHVTQHAMYETAADRSQTPDIRAYAQRTAPIIQQHIEMLRSMYPQAVSGL